MSKFQKGDVIKCVHTHPYNPDQYGRENELFTVSFAYNRLIHVENRTGTMSEDRFELVARKKQEPLKMTDEQRAKKIRDLLTDLNKELTEAKQVNMEVDLFYNGGLSTPLNVRSITKKF